MTASGTTTAFARLLPPLRPEWRRIVRGYGLGTVSVLALTAIAVLASYGVGRAIVHREWPPAAWWVGLAALVALRTFLTWREMDVSHALAYRVLARLRVALFDAYARSVPGRTREHSGRTASVVMTDIEKLEFFYAHTIAQLGASLTLFLLATIGTAMILPEAGLVVLVGGAAVALTAVLGAAPARRLGDREQQERAEQSEKLVDALGAMREILAYGLQQRVAREAIDDTQCAARTSRRRALASDAVSGARDLILTSVVVGVLLLGIVVADGASGSRASDLAALLPALIALAVAGVAAMGDAAHTITELHPLAASARRVGAALAQPAVVTATADPVSLPDGPLGIRFRDVCFSYDQRTPVLRDWSAEIAPGEHVGLAGASGAGKSTVIALAARLWDPDAGTIELIDETGRGFSLAEVSDGDLRRAVAVVEQEARLFHGTVRENLLRGTGERDDDELRAALVRVGADGWISLDDRVGEQGVRLSGGQRARLALARALVRKPRILIVDELTASLDPATERHISAVLASFEGTVLAASHRKETLGMFTRVIRFGPA